MLTITILTCGDTGQGYNNTKYKIQSLSWRDWGIIWKTIFFTHEEGVGVVFCSLVKDVLLCLGMYTTLPPHGLASLEQRLPVSQEKVKPLVMLTASRS